MDLKLGGWGHWSHEMKKQPSAHGSIEMNDLGTDQKKTVLTYAAQGNLDAPWFYLCKNKSISKWPQITPVPYDE